MANAAAKRGPSLGMRDVGAYRKFVDLLNIHEVSPEPPKASKAPKVETPHRTLDGLGALGGVPSDAWNLNDWLAYFDERAGIAEFDVGMPRDEAEATAYEACLVEWQNLNPAISSPSGHCAQCGGADASGDILLPYGVATQTWLHSRCWSQWILKRRGEAEDALQILGIKWTPPKVPKPPKVTTLLHP